jgi:hypothetical protein
MVQRSSIGVSIGGGRRGEGRTRGRICRDRRRAALFAGAALALSLLLAAQALRALGLWEAYGPADPSLLALSGLPNRTRAAGRGAVVGGGASEEANAGGQNNASALPARITAAVCHPTLHSSPGGRPPDLGQVVHWARYYRLLGFDHLFLWHQPEVASLQPEEFEGLRSLPYVTLTEANVTSESAGPYYGQGRAESECPGILARNYTWALVIDADEYLWLAGEPDVKDFLARHDPYRYLSFGKRMYTLRYRHAGGGGGRRNESLFGGLNHHAFTAGSYCYSNPNADTCPTWTGRAKVMVRPADHPGGVRVHGDPFQHDGLLHLSPAMAHLKEWPGLLVYPRWNLTPDRPSNTSFSIPANNAAPETQELGLYWVAESHRRDPGDPGAIRIEHDPGLRGWFELVHARGQEGPPSGAGGGPARRRAGALAAIAALLAAALAAAPAWL